MLSINLEELCKNPKKFNERISLTDSQKQSLLTPNIIPSDTIIYSGQGASLETSKGSLIDMCSMTVNCILGQNDPWIKANLISYLLSDAPSFHSSRFGSATYYSLPLRLEEIHIAGMQKPCINHRQCNGSDVTELAVKLAYLQRGNRKKIVSLEGSYHGQNLTNYFISEIQLKHRFLSSTKEVVFLPTPTNSELGSELLSKNDKESLNLLRSIAEDVFAIIIEPIQMNNGVNVLSKAFLQGLRKIADEYHIALIFDEIQTGFGWLGTLSAAEINEVVPDIFCASKALTAGFGPLAITASREPYTKLDYGSGEKTSGSDIRSCISACAVLDRLLGIPKETIPSFVNDDLASELESGLLCQVPEKSKMLLSEVEKLKEAFPDIIKSIRGSKFILGLELVNDKGEPDIEFAGKVTKEAAQRGVFVKQTKNVIIIKPPIVNTKEEVSL